MNLKNVFLLTAVIAAIFGLLFLLVPVTLMSWYGVTLNEPAVWIGRFLGAAFIGFAVVAWFAKDADPSRARRGIELGYFAGFAIGFVVSLLGPLSGFTNTLGWVTVIIYALFAAAYGYFAFMAGEARPSLAG